MYNIGLLNTVVVPLDKEVLVKEGIQPVKKALVSLGRCPISSK